MTIEELGHPQHKTMVNCNNATAVGIANNTVKQQCLQSWKWGVSGYVISFPKMHIMLNGTLARKILPITKVSTTLGLITKMYAHGTHTKKITLGITKGNQT
jgi:hypothetical protein